MRRKKKVSHSEAHLKNCRVLVTRPEHSARQQCDAIIARSGRPIAIPALSISPIGAEELQVVRDLLERLPYFAQIVFCSVNAVQNGFAVLRELDRELPATVHCHAIGPATAQALLQRGVENVQMHGMSSESLAQQSALQHVAGQQVLIFCGVNPRPWLGDTLRSRGAEVHYCAVYRRSCPERNGPVLRAALQAERLDAVLAASMETVQNLLRLAGDMSSRLRMLPLCVASSRIAEAARILHFRTVLEAADARDESMVCRLAEYWSGRRGL